MVFYSTKSTTNVNKHVQKLFNIKERPNSSCGLWLFYILPLCIIISALKLAPVSKQYHQMSVFAIQLLFASLIFMKTYQKNILYKNKLLTLIGGVLFIFGVRYIELDLNPVPIFLTLCFFVMQPAIMMELPSCFSVGEAALVTQALLMFVYSTILNLTECLAVKLPSSNIQITTTVLQIGISGILLFATTVRKLKFFQNAYSFYISLGLTACLGILFPMYLVLQKDPLFWILEFVFESQRRLLFLVYWGVCVLLAAWVTMKQIEGKRRANTVKRKVFHILAVAVYLPALIFECTFIYLASGVAMAIFFILELARLYDIPPIGQSLHNGFLIFVDEKDSTGGVSLSPIYLLVGISLPLWIHPNSCDVTDSAGFQLLPLISGLLTVGIGDTSASVVGLTFGKHRWPGSKKTFEGTIGAIISQMLCLVILCYMGFLSDYDLKKGGMAVVITSIIEAKTDQVDNLVLPITGYLLMV